MCAALLECCWNLVFFLTQGSRGAVKYWTIFVITVLLAAGSDSLPPQQRGNGAQQPVLGDGASQARVHRQGQLSSIVFFRSILLCCVDF